MSNYFVWTQTDTALSTTYDGWKTGEPTMSVYETVVKMASVDNFKYSTKADLDNVNPVCKIGM